MERIEFPCVVKKSGSKGEKVWKVEDEKSLLEKLSGDGELAIIQEYLKNDHDFRVFVQDEEILAVIKRNSADGFYNNVSQGGKPELAEITTEEASACIKAAKIAGLRLAGVDLLRHENCFYILEVNKNPQVILFDEITDNTLSTKVCEHVVKSLLSSPNNRQ